MTDSTKPPGTKPLVMADTPLLSFRQNTLIETFRNLIRYNYHELLSLLTPNLIVLEKNRQQILFSPKENEQGDTELLPTITLNSSQNMAEHDLSNNISLITLPLRIFVKSRTDLSPAYAVTKKDTVSYTGGLGFPVSEYTEINLVCLCRKTDDTPEGIDFENIGTVLPSGEVFLIGEGSKTDLFEVKKEEILNKMKK